MPIFSLLVSPCSVIHSCYHSITSTLISSTPIYVNIIYHIYVNIIYIITSISISSITSTTISIFVSWLLVISMRILSSFICICINVNSSPFAGKVTTTTFTASINTSLPGMEEDEAEENRRMNSKCLLGVRCGCVEAGKGLDATQPHTRGWLGWLCAARETQVCNYCCGGARTGKRRMDGLGVAVCLLLDWFTWWACSGSIKCTLGNCMY